MAQITLNDISLGDCQLSNRASCLKDIYFRALPEICVERPRLITRYHVEHGLFAKQQISILDKARAYRYALENRAPVVWHEQACDKDMQSFNTEDISLFAGATTSKFKGVPLYPEFLALSIWPELWTISERESNPYHIEESEVKELNYDIFPHWIENSILEVARSRAFDPNWEKFDNKDHLPEIKLLEQLVFFMAGKPNCISHTIPDFSRAINSGLRHIIDEAKAKETAAEEISKKEFYAAVSEVLEGIISYSRNLSQKAEQMAAGETDPVRKMELLDFAEINDRVPELPARNFREGLTTIWICWVAIHLENPNVGLSLGRLDQVLYDLYRRDVDEQKISIAEAIELICCLWLKIGDHVPMVPDAGEQLFGGSGSNQAITLGGVDSDGNDAVNDLTYVMLRATELMRLRDPNPNARYYPEINSRDYLKRLCEININTGAIPAIHNDRAVIEALKSKGETPAQARDYGVIGCVEPGSSGRFYGNSAAILLNLTSALELTLFNGRHRHTGMARLISKETGSPEFFSSFDEFKAAFEAQTGWLVDQATSLNNHLGRIHQDIYPTPILSALFEGPMDKGMDLIDGGAEINASGAAVIGLADVADSLSAIQEVVFRERRVTLPEMIKILKKDFEGNFHLQLRLMNSCKTPKYGNEHEAADANVTWVVNMLDNAFGRKANYRGGHYRVGYWTMTNNAGFGRLMGAMPSGRKAGENFASGFTPVSGVTPYLTPALNSVAKQPARCFANGIALNLKYTPETEDKAGMLDNFVASVEGYFDTDDNRRDGGMEIQFIVRDHETLEKAAQDPDEYSDLLVRVSGYTAYFKDLNPRMQKEIIDRTEYKLSTGEMISFEPFPLPEEEL